MNYFIKLSKNYKIKGSLTIINCRDEEIGSPASDKLYLTGNENHTSIDELNIYNKQIYIIGDPIYHEGKTAQHYFEKDDLGHFIQEVDGFYFLIIWDIINSKFSAVSSLFNILPVFYADEGDSFLVSSSFEIIKNSLRSVLRPDKQYYLEKALFNYPLFERTPFEEIKTIPSNCLLELTDKVKIKKHTVITDYFTDNPQPWRKSLNYLSDFFIQQSVPFIPEQPFIATLTGGLDGRTLVGLSLALKRSFFTYSYGTELNKDITIPRHISETLGIPYKPLIIDDDYLKYHSWLHGLQFLKKSFGLGNISRAHYSYACENVLNKSGYLVSGNFGSEIIRSMKIPGVMTSELLFELFEQNSPSALKEKMINYPGIKYLSANLVQMQIDDLLETITGYLNRLPSGLTSNQKFYIYLFEEVFPKYFGPEISFQRNYFKHRAPFLSFGFIKELLQTEIAGANSNFKETSPFKRYRGQVLYAHIIKKTAPELLNFKLDKEYRPVDFLSPFGSLNIAFGYTAKKIKYGKPKMVANYSRKNMIQNAENISNVSLTEELFNKAHFNHQLEQISSTDIMHFTNNLSAALYQKYLTNDLP